MSSCCFPFSFFRSTCCDAIIITFVLCDDEKWNPWNFHLEIGASELHSRFRLQLSAQSILTLIYARVFREHKMALRRTLSSLANWAHSPPTTGDIELNSSLFQWMRVYQVVESWMENRCSFDKRSLAPTPRLPLEDLSRVCACIHTLCCAFQVNDVPLCPMTHEQAVIFLRQAADRVKLRLYRDDGQTPIASMSPTSCENKAINHATKQKACLR